MMSSLNIAVKNPLELATVSVVDAVEKHLKALIRDGSLKPGDQLPSERELQASLGVSRLPLREGLARLSALGLIRIRHGQGAFVEEAIRPSALSDCLIPFFPDRNPKVLQDLIAARSFLEGELAALAAARGTPDDWTRLAKLAAARPAAQNDAGALADADAEFHHEIARIADNAFMAAMYVALAPHIRAFMVTYARTDADRRAALERNCNLVATLREGDPQKAATEARAHLQPCLKSLIRTSDTPASS